MTTIDLSDIVHFDPSQKPGRVFGDCKHECAHDVVDLVALGPDERRFKLFRCACNACTRAPSIQCRAWYTIRGNRWGPWRAVWVGGHTEWSVES